MKIIPTIKKKMEEEASLLHSLIDQKRKAMPMPKNLFKNAVTMRIVSSKQNEKKDMELDERLKIEEAQKKFQSIKKYRESNKSGKDLKNVSSKFIKSQSQRINFTL